MTATTTASSYGAAVNKPRVSVVMPSFNRVDFTLEAISSLQAQTFPDWEAILVDDGSTSDCLERLRAACNADTRLRVLSRNLEQKGAGVCRNIGLREARADCVLFLDSDDLLAQSCLEQRFAALSGSHHAPFVVFPSALFRAKPGDIALPWNVDTSEPDAARFIRGDSPWPISGSLWRKEVLVALGGFDTSLVCWQDIDLHFRATLDSTCYIKRLESSPDNFIRRHPQTSISQGGFDRPEHYASLGRVLFKAAMLLREAGANGTPGSTPINHSLLVSLNYVLRNTLQRKFFALCGSLADEAKVQGLITTARSAAWHFAINYHRARLDKLLGGRWMRRRLIAGYDTPPWGKRLVREKIPGEDSSLYDQYIQA